MLEFTFTTSQEKIQGTSTNIAGCLLQANRLCQAHYWRLTTIWELTKKECQGLVEHYTAHTKRPKKPYLSQNKIGTLAIKEKPTHDL